MRIISGFDNYSISSSGDVFSKNSNKYLSPIKQRNGYLSVTLYRNKKPFIKSVHRLVAEHFIANTSKFKCINHKDGNKHNNISSNLEWCSHSYNSLHSFRELGRIIWNKGKTSVNISNSKKGHKNPVAIEVINIYSGFVYDTITQAANDKNISINTVYSRIRRNSKVNEFAIL